jgi:tyrosyl-tRNA synthetase
MWLGSHRMSPYAFFQGWMHIDDGDVRRLLRQLTFLSLDEVEAVAAAHDAAPERRVGQRRLAAEVTTLVHGADAAAAAAEASGILFGGDPTTASEAALRMVAGEVDTTKIDTNELASGLPIVDVLVLAGLAKSKGEARRLLEQGGVSLNGETILGDRVVTGDDALYGALVLLRRGKKRWHVLQSGEAHRTG